MSASPLSPEEIRAAAATHSELGPEYSDAVIASFLEKVDRQITARVDARLADAPRRPAPAEPDSRHTLLKGVAIGTGISTVPLIWMAMAAAGGAIMGPKIFWWVALLLAVVTAGCAAGAVRGRRRPAGRPRIGRDPGLAALRPVQPGRAWSSARR